MSRPGIVRADTVDLQDTDHPSASEHPKSPATAASTGLAPHQAAEISHVLRERHSEEQSLADAWSVDDQQQHDPTHAAGENTTAGEDGEGDADADEDMLDRISSSPSIDDEREGFNSSSDSIASSPFLQTPQHMPLGLAREGEPLTRVLMMEESLSSPFDDSSTRSAVVWKADGEEHSWSSAHHHLGRYRREPGPLGRIDEYAPLSRSAMSDDDAASEASVIVDPSLRPIESPFRRHSFARRCLNSRMASLEQSTSFNSMHSLDLAFILLPVDDDPLLDTPPSPTDSAGDSPPLDYDDDYDDYDSTNDDDDADDDPLLFHDLPPRFIDSGWGGDCLRGTEDIDFEFVYALHTFVATVEGQANATKGDTMVLLDDSNSYWWLVRVVKDSSIGYLPAEHIETPTERLARLNKHRNIDLSATMLSDNSEKTRNPLKKAMRRRNAKTVQFAAPTYVEASDYDYSTEEDEGHHAGPTDPYTAAAAQSQSEETQHQASEVAPEDDLDHERALTPPTRGSFEREQVATSALAEDPQTSPKLIDKTEAAPLKSRKGTHRNADSFLRDDSIETKKLTLTPGLLREDNTSLKSLSSESARNASTESLVKSSSPPDSGAVSPGGKAGAKKEGKKGGMLSGLFKSKKKDKERDKRSTEDLMQAGEQSEVEKGSSVELGRERGRASPAGGERSSPVGGERAPGMLASKPAVQAAQVAAGVGAGVAAGVAAGMGRGKLQKPTPAPQQQQQPQQQLLTRDRATQSGFVAELPGSEVAYEMEQPIAAAPIVGEPEQVQPQAPSSQRGSGPLATITNAFMPHGNTSKAKRGKQRVELDDFDEDIDQSVDDREREVGAMGAEKERLSESPIEIMPGSFPPPTPLSGGGGLGDSTSSGGSGSFMHGTEIVHIPTPGFEPDGDEDEAEESARGEEERYFDHEPASNRGLQHDDADDGEEPEEGDEDEALTPTAPLSPERNLKTQHDAPTPDPLPPWSDTRLRAWLDDGSEVREMLLLIQHDRGNEREVQVEQPLVKGLFKEHEAGVEGLSRELDGLLGNLLSRRGVSY